MRPTSEEIERTARTIAATKFFPSSDPHIWRELLSLLVDIVGTSEQCDWLRRVFRDQVTEWCGLAEVRNIFATRFKPADGIEGTGYSAISGFTPGDIERESLAAREQKYLPGRDDEPIGQLPQQIAAAAKRLAIPEPVQPLSDEERDVIAKLTAKVKAQVAKETETPYSRWLKKHELKPSAAKEG